MLLSTTFSTEVGWIRSFTEIVSNPTQQLDCVLSHGSSLASRFSLHLKESPPSLQFTLVEFIGVLYWEYSVYGTALRYLVVHCSEPVPGLFAVFSVPGRWTSSKRSSNLIGSRTHGSHVCALDATEIWGQLL